MDVEALTRDGRRLSRRWRRTVGRKQGAAFAAGLEGGSPVVLAEGAVDALACRWLHPEAECLAMGGTAGISAWRPAPGDDRTVLVEADGDSDGDLAPIRLRERLGTGRVRVQWRSCGDPAADLADAVQERAAILEFEADCTPCEAERQAWENL